MHVVQSRHHRVPLQINDPGLRRTKLPDRFIISHSNDDALAHSQSLLPSAGRINLAIAENQVRCFPS